jgi:formate hydrogenlyase subunit 6/NADH:ubiquinone oxidoreductase subunit I
MWEWWISFGYLVGLFERETKWKTNKNFPSSVSLFGGDHNKKNKWCIGCGLCAIRCPMNNIRKKRRLTRTKGKNQQIRN